GHSGRRFPRAASRADHRTRDRRTWRPLRFHSRLRLAQLGRGVHRRAHAHGRGRLTCYAGGLNGGGYMAWNSVRRGGSRMLASACLLCTGVTPATAQTFPTSGWLPLTQHGAILGDPFDGTFAVPGIDLVGDKSNPAAFVASDSGYLYFRVLVASNPYNISR